MKMRNLLLIFACLLLPMQPLVGLEGKEGLSSGTEIPAQTQADIVVFVREGCSHCEEAKGFLSKLQAEFPKLRIEARDISKDSQALNDLKTLAATTPRQLVAVPTFFVRGHVIVGFSGPEGTGKAIRDLLELSQAPKPEKNTGSRAPSTTEQTLPPVQTIRVPFLGDVSVDDYSLPVFTIIIGLVDGINPCAMWVLLFIISLLVHFKSRKKMLLVAGTFIMVSGIVYFLFMTAWLNFFLLVGSGRWIQIILGLIALFAGIVNVKDYFAFRKGVTLSIPESAKPWIGRQINKILNANNVFATLIAVSVLAFLVNAVELLCTAGLPAIYTQILSSHSLPAWKYYGYLVLYNIAYMLDDAIVVFLAVLTLNPQRLSESKGRLLKLLSGLIMIALAAMLLFKPEWLNWKF